MATRERERAFARRAFGAAEGDRFFTEACSGCHVAICADCHGETPHARTGPDDDACRRCHQGYSVGWEYGGMAPREDHVRYQRGPTSQSAHFLSMLPDVHQEKGLRCRDCHPMRSLHLGRQGALPCRDCHPPDRLANPAHAIEAHSARVSCVACHAAWAAQEYGTFLVKPASDELASAFKALPRWGTWRKSSHLKRQGPPPLGVDQGGLVTPIRPQFILFVTDPARGWENRLMAAEWRPTSPHTVRRGTVACEGCHGRPERFLLEPEAARIYRIDRDGLALQSYWNRAGQRVVNGSFLPVRRYLSMNRKTPEFARGVVGRWQDFLAHVDPR